MSKRRLFSLILVGIIGIISFLIITQSYPVALVNWRPISFQTFKKNSAAALYYYQKVSETYNLNNAVIIDSLGVKQEVERAVLDKLIENILIHQELKERFKNNEMKRMVENKIEEAIKGKNIEKEVKILYDLSLDEFKERLLKPQAEQEILAGRLLLENKNFDDWLKETKLKAKVIILLPNFEWKDGRVIIK